MLDYDIMNVLTVVCPTNLSSQMLFDPMVSNEHAPADQGFDDPSAHLPCRLAGRVPRALLVNRYLPKLNVNHSMYVFPTFVWYDERILSVGVLKSGI